MESLEDVHWDVVLSGTALPQSLLALYVVLLEEFHKVRRSFLTDKA